MSNKQEGKEICKKKEGEIRRILTQPSGVFRTHPTMCRAVAVDCVKRLYDGLWERTRWECWGGGVGM